MKKLENTLFCTATIINGLFILFVPIQADAQSYSPYFNLEQHQKYIEYLINSGKTEIGHPLSQPFTSNELEASLGPASSRFDTHWLGLLKKDLSKFSTSNDTLNENGRLIAGIEGGIRENYSQDELTNEFFGSLFTGYSYKNVGIFYRFTADEAYKLDTNYFGSTGKLEKPIFYHSSEAYFKWDIKNVSLFIGRSGINCGIMNEPGLIVSENPVSYDRIGLTFANKTIKFSTFISRLNDIYGYDVRDSVPDYNWDKRYFSMHRIEISASSKLEIALTETILYGGQNQNILYQYINPVNLFYLSKLAERKGYEEDYGNAFATLEVYYKPVKKITVYTQFLIDDMDFTKDLREQYPDRLGVSGKLIFSDPWPGYQFSLLYNRISNWTYNSFYTLGNYTFYGKSIGYPKHGVEKISFEVFSFKYSPFLVGLTSNWEKQRSQDLESPFIAEKTSFPVGIAQQKASFTMKVVYSPLTYLSASFDLEYAHYSNFEHVQGYGKDFMNIFVTIKASGIFSSK